MDTKSTKSKQDWQTPSWFFNALQQVLGVAFTLDAFASKENALCTHFYDGNEHGNGLLEAWAAPTFWNPPFKLISKVVDKAIYESRHGVTSCGIAPANLETKWAERALDAGAKLRVIRPRLKFEGGNGNSPPHATVLILLGLWIPQIESLQIWDFYPRK